LLVSASPRTFLADKKGCLTEWLVIVGCSCTGCSCTERGTLCVRHGVPHGILLLETESRTLDSSTAYPSA